MLACPVIASFFLLFCLVSQAWNQEKTIYFESAPPNARIYEYRSGAFLCIGRTPIKLAVLFSSASLTKEFQIRKFGYKPLKSVVRRSDDTMRIKLEKSEIFAIPNLASGEVPLIARKQAFDVIANSVYNDTAFDNAGFDQFGKITFVEFDDGYFVELPVILDDSFRQEKLWPILRIRNLKDRQRALLEAVLDHVGNTLIVGLGGELRNINNIKGLVLNVNYRKTRSAIGEDVRHFLQTNVAWGPTETYPWTSYFTYNREVKNTIIEDIDDVFQIVIKTGLKDIPKEAGRITTWLFNNAEIYCDDNRDKKLERIEK